MKIGALIALLTCLTACAAGVPNSGGVAVIRATVDVQVATSRGCEFRSATTASASALDGLAQQHRANLFVVNAYNSYRSSTTEESGTFVWTTIVSGSSVSGKFVRCPESLLRKLVNEQGASK